MPASRPLREGGPGLAADERTQKYDELREDNVTLRTRTDSNAVGKKAEEEMFGRGSYAILGVFLARLSECELSLNDAFFNDLRKP